MKTHNFSILRTREKTWMEFIRVWGKKRNGDPIRQEVKREMKKLARLKRSWLRTCLTCATLAGHKLETWLAQKHTEKPKPSCLSCSTGD